MIYRQVSVGVLNTNQTISEPKNDGNAKEEQDDDEEEAEEKTCENKNV